MMVLILDQGYSPHRVVSWQRAVCMLFCGKIEVLEEYDEEISSPSLSIRIPAVVRLLSQARRQRRVVRFSRFNVFLRDGFACQYCGVLPEPRDLTLDHVVPRARGGGTRWTNVVAACRPCNHRKGNRTPDEARMQLARPAQEPRFLPSASSRIREREVHAKWEAWVA